MVSSKQTSHSPQVHAPESEKTIIKIHKRRNGIFHVNVRNVGHKREFCGLPVGAEKGRSLNQRTWMGKTGNSKVTLLLFTFIKATDQESRVY